MADFRPNTTALIDFQRIFPSAESPPAGKVSRRFLAELVLAPASPVLHGDLVDIEDPSARRTLEHRHAGLLHEHGMPHLDLSELRSQDRTVTQAFSRDLYEQGAAGIIFRSRLDDQTCIALFEGRANLHLAGTPEELVPSLDILVQVCDEFGLALVP